MIFSVKAACTRFEKGFPQPVDELVETATHAFKALPADRGGGSVPFDEAGSRGTCSSDQDFLCNRLAAPQRLLEVIYLLALPQSRGGLSGVPHGRRRLARHMRRCWRGFVYHELELRNEV